MTRLKEVERELIKMEGRLEDLKKAQQEMPVTVKKKKKKKEFKVPGKVKRMMKTSTKMVDQVLLLYLTQKYQAKFMLSKIVSGNIVVVRNKAHKLNPKAMWNFGKNRFYVIREIDRRPVSNLDYDKVRKQGHHTDDDPVLIKAVLGAIQKQTSSPLQNKGLIAGIIMAVIVLIILYSVFFT